MIVEMINIIDHVPITLNIDARLINPHIIDVEKYLLLPKLGKPLVDAVAAAQVASTTFTVWNSATNYLLATPSRVIHNNQIWECLINNTNSAPTPTNVNWLLKDVFTFWYAHIKPYASFLSIARYIPYAGNNFTQGGITTPFGTQFQPSSDRDKGGILNDLNGKANIESGLMYKYLSSKSWTLDLVIYVEPVDRPIRENGLNFSISAIG